MAGQHTNRKKRIRFSDQGGDDSTFKKKKSNRGTPLPTKNKQDNGLVSIYIGSPQIIPEPVQAQPPVAVQGPRKPGIFSRLKSSQQQQQQQSRVYRPGPFGMLK